MDGVGCACKVLYGTVLFPAVLIGSVASFHQYAEKEKLPKATDLLINLKVLK